MATLLAVWMRENGFTNAQVGSELGVGREVVWAYATGQRLASPRFKWLFTERFGIEATNQAFGVELARSTEPIQSIPEPA